MPALAAMLAEDFGALGGHFKFCMAVRALIQHLLQTLSPVAVSDAYVVFQLITVFVIFHGLTDDGIDFRNRHTLYLLCRQHLAKHGVQGHLMLVFVGPERRVEVVAVMRHHH